MIPKLLNRFPLPDWYLEMGGHTSNVEDWTDGRCSEQEALRDAQIVMFGRICVYDPLRMPLLQHLAGMFDSIDLKTASPMEAEVPLTLMITLSHELNDE